MPNWASRLLRWAAIAGVCALRATPGTAAQSTPIATPATNLGADGGEFFVDPDSNAANQFEAWSET